MPARHSRPRGAGRGVAAGLATALLAAAAAGAVLLVPHLVPACPVAPVTIAVTPSFAEPLRRALDGGRAAGRLDACAEIRVLATEAADVRAAVAADPGSAPDVWIPESSVWPAGDGAAGSGVTEVGHGSVATSLVSVVLPSTDSGRYGAPTARPTWPQVLTAATPPQLVDLGVSTASRLVLVTLVRSLRGPDGNPTGALAASVLGLGNAALPHEDDGFALIRRDGAGAPAFLSSTRAVRAFNDTRPPVRAVALQPVGSPSLDHPFVELVRPGRDARVGDAVRAVRAWLGAPAARSVFEAAGYAPARDAPVDAAALDGALRAFDALREDSSVLAVVDVSGSMAAAAGGGRTRIRLAAEAAAAGMALFPPGFEVGLWTFSARPAPAPDWDVVVPTGPLDEPLGAGGPTRRDALLAGARELAAVPDAGTALHSTVLAAVRAARDGYRPGREHSVVVFTDGRDEEDDGIGLDELLATLRAEADPRRPVSVVTVGAGPDADLAALERIAEVTQGRAYGTDDPADIREVFLDALTLRLCRPDC